MTALAAGIGILLIAELFEWAALRILAIVLLVGGAIAAGIASGSNPQATTALERASAIFSRAAVSAVAVLLAAPALAVLAFSLYGALTRLTSSNAMDQTPMLILGSLIGLLLFALATTVVILGIGAIRGKTPNQTAEKAS